MRTQITERDIFRQETPKAIGCSRIDMKKQMVLSMKGSDLSETEIAKHSFQGSDESIANNSPQWQNWQRVVAEWLYQESC